MVITRDTVIRIKKINGKSKKGHVPWNKDKHIQLNTGRTHFKKGCVPWNKGLTKYTDPRLKKFGQARRGNKNPMYGKYGNPWNKGLTKETDERLRKLSESLKGQASWIEGKHWSKKMRQKLSESHKHYTKEQLRNMLQRRIPSSLEEKFQNIIDKHNLPYKYVGDGSFILGNYNPDFINTNDAKIAVEVYARYYKKRNHINIEKWKQERIKIFGKYGWDLLFFDETEVNEENILKCLLKEDTKLN